METSFFINVKLKVEENYTTSIVEKPKKGGEEGIKVDRVKNDRVRNNLLMKLQNP